MWESLANHRVGRASVFERACERLGTEWRKWGIGNVCEEYLGGGGGMGGV